MDVDAPRDGNVRDSWCSRELQNNSLCGDPRLCFALFHSCCRSSNSRWLPGSFPVLSLTCMLRQNGQTDATQASPISPPLNGHIIRGSIGLKKHGLSAQHWINWFCPQNESQGDSGRAGRQLHSKAQPPEKMLRWLREKNGTMYSLIFYLRLRHLWERFSVRTGKSEIARSRSKIRYDSSSGTFDSQIFGVAAARELPYPATHMHLAEFLQVQHSDPVHEGRSSSPTRRTSLWRSWQESQRSSRQIHSTLRSRRSSWQVQWENVRASKLRYFLWLSKRRWKNCWHTKHNRSSIRIMAWWLMLHSWGTLRFADHRGLEPRNVPFDGGAFGGGRAVGRILETR